MLYQNKWVNLDPAEHITPKRNLPTHTHNDLIDVTANLNLYKL